MGADVRAIYKGLPAMPEEEEQELFDMRDCELEEARSHMQAPQRGARPPEEKGCIFDEKMAAREQFLPGKLWCERKYDTRLRAFANEGATALHDAAEGGFKRTCLVLLAAGASLHATDADGDASLHHAATIHIDEPDTTRLPPSPTTASLHRVSLFSHPAASRIHRGALPFTRPRPPASLLLPHPFFPTQA